MGLWGWRSMPRGTGIGGDRGWLGYCFLMIKRNFLFIGAGLTVQLCYKACVKSCFGQQKKDYGRLNNRHSLDSKKRIAIISSQYFWLPEEAGPTRFYYLAKMFQKYGYDVTVITSSFEHHEKVQRDKVLSSNFNIIYIDCPSYKKNVDFRREISNFVFEWKVKKVLEKSKVAYDVVYCSLPPNNISKVVGKYCFQHHIPFIADIEDLWPEAMAMILDKPVIRKLIFFPFQRDAEKTYQYADAVIGTSKEYSLRASKYNGRHIPYRTVYVGCDLDAFDKEAEGNIDAVKKPGHEVWVTYAGSIGHSYAIGHLVKAAGLLQAEGHDQIKFKILGNGPLKEEAEQLAKDLRCTNVEFLGYVEHAQMAAVLMKSDILVNSFAKGAPQSIVNKIGDYLAAGRPIINTLENAEFCRLVDVYKIGVNVEAENEEALSRSILALLSDLVKLKGYGVNARKLCERQFDRKNSYLKIVELANMVILRKKHGEKTKKRN